MSEDSPQPGHWMEIGALMVVGALATFVRLAADPPHTLARMAWLMMAGLGLATGGWLIAKAAGLDGWTAMAAAWVFGAIGSEATLALIKRWVEARIGTPPRPPQA